MSTKSRRRLTVDLPVALVEQADALVARGAARSRNCLIAQALEMLCEAVGGGSD